MAESSPGTFEEALRTMKDQYRRLVAEKHALELRLETTQQQISKQDMTSEKECHTLEVPSALRADTQTAFTEDAQTEGSTDQEQSKDKTTYPSEQNRGSTLLKRTKSEIENSLLLKNVKTYSIRRSKSRVDRLHDLALAQGWVRKLTTKPSGRIARAVNSKWFDFTASAAIILNAVLIALATDHAARNEIAEQEDMPRVYVIVEFFFCIFFSIELVLRVCKDGPVFFWSCASNSQWNWNYFDTVVVTLGVGEIVYHAGTSGRTGNLTALRMLRVLRVARAIRILKLIRAFKELRLMVMSLMNSLTTLLWAIVLLMVVIFLFSIFLTQNVNTYLYAEVHSIAGNSHAKKLKDWFGSLSLASYTLFMAVSGGIDWEMISDTLFRIDWFNGFLFCFYIFFTVFAMLNIITGVFLDTAMRAAQSDKDECISAQLNAKDSAVKEMRQIFKMVDSDQSNEITAEEFEKHLNEPRMHAQLASIGLEASEAQGLFRLLDLDNSGTVTIEEFLHGCMRLKGSAKAIDVATLLYENKRLFDKWRSFSSYVEEQFQARNEFEDRLEATFKEILTPTSLSTACSI